MELLSRSFWATSFTQEGIQQCNKHASCRPTASNGCLCSQNFIVCSVHLTLQRQRFVTLHDAHAPQQLTANPLDTLLHLIMRRQEEITRNDGVIKL